jgi:hypothetical protein
MPRCFEDSSLSTGRGARSADENHERELESMFDLSKESAWR